MIFTKLLMALKQFVEAYGYPLTLKGIKDASNLVDYKIYGNSKQANIPDEYTQLECITSDGTQYIDTGLKGGKFVHDISFSLGRNLMGFSTTAGTFWGTREDGINYELGINVITAPITHRRTITYNTLGDTFSLETEGNSITYSKSSVVDTYCLLHIKNSNYYCSANLYGFKAYDSNNQLIMDLIPAKRNSDNKLGMYDVISTQFYTNSGTNEFIQGDVAPTVNTPINIQGIGIQTKNLFDKTQTLTDNTYLNSDGTITNNNFWYTTDYIPVNGNSFTLTRDSELGITPCLIGYDADKKLVVATMYNYSKVVNITTDKTIKFIRFSINKSNEDLNVLQLEEGNTATDYEQYGYKINITATNGDNTITEVIPIVLDKPLYRTEACCDYLDFKKQCVVRKLQLIDSTGCKPICDSLMELSQPLIQQVDLPDLPIYEGTTTYTIEGLQPSQMYGKGRIQLED